MSQGRQDILSGTFLLVLSIILFLMIPSQVETTEGDSLTPASLPLIITAVIGVLSAALLFQGLRAGWRNTSAGQTVGASGLLYVGATIAVMATYAGLINWAGYIAATLLALLALALLYGNRNWVQIAIIIIVAPPLILLFFRFTMLVLLPQGRLVQFFLGS